MSASALTPTSWRGDQRGYGHSAYDPAQSFAYTSACSGPRPRVASTNGSAGSLGGPPVRLVVVYPSPYYLQGRMLCV